MRSAIICGWLLLSTTVLAQSTASENYTLGPIDLNAGGRTAAGGGVYELLSATGQAGGVGVISNMETTFSDGFIYPGTNLSDVPPDCNDNGSPDDIDIANGTSEDCNANGVPDECDLAEGTSLDLNDNGIPDECEDQTGDMNCDGFVDFDDISPFVLALGGQSGYEAAYPDCNWYHADCNNDGSVDFDDINAFITLLGG